MLSGWLALPSQALIVEDDAGYDHASPDPLRAPMLENVGQLGQRRSGSVVYLGQGWVLTAHHAFAGRTSDAVILAGEEYRLRPSRAVRLKNPAGDGASRWTDLVMVPLQTLPDLPNLKINELTPFSGEAVVMVGCGETVERGAGLVQTEVPEHGSQVALQPISGPEPGGVAGPRWGENEIAERHLSVKTPDGIGQTQTYATIRQPDQWSGNAQGAAGDSGGGVFVKRGERWELSGIMLSVLHREDLNASATFIADLAVYREQILTNIPEPSAAALLMLAALLGGARRRR